MSSHYLKPKGNNSSSSVECDRCHMLLPNECSLAAHGRIHERSKPFGCPECAKTFDTWSVFQNHVQTSCFHESRVLSINCKLCEKKNSKLNGGASSSNQSNTSVINAQGFLDHMFRVHTKLFYKCTGCARDGRA
jgi:hypothetical protein